ncbi:hypothetical protein DDB_G0289359 [Dictyostelium discoideum AX4]|uniref:Putative uncharacterized protein DDB_G0289359 n=1 Tax=Dictyostelium discoideum TaxID=44689 RepID=Y8382_DICDI|nr:hypothetical protein DDB_G0289359 [Dictyostelium discoideum AX4]Q54HM1.1 RecName: Full=Putative uncharacterized protein DDB_G0289359 [Dictyostelium discoideum]EAL62766.1 hypothetical protein DDB_G0289359 [Dictyostelium discoideum AX4]|eukprot:XP_636280.1 hypothetical protein DDB_G0289359 [Dictyostelium discoideum AX4]
MSINIVHSNENNEENTNIENWTTTGTNYRNECIARCGRLFSGFNALICMKPCGV